MNIEITRHNYSKYAVDGKLSINGEYVCDTCEHPVNYMTAGKYNISIVTNKKLHRMAPTFPNGAIIKPGNGPFSLTDGSIIVGKHALRGLLVETAECFSKLIDRLDKASNRNEEITITIK